MTLEQQILKALEFRPLSMDELKNHLGPQVPEQDIQHALFVMRESKMWIDKHPVIGGGCKTCACEVSFKWRLTLSGRQELSKIE